MEYGKLENGNFVKAPAGVHWNGAYWPSPSAAIYLACDEGPFYPKHNGARTAAPEGEHWTARIGWELVENEIWGVYAHEPDEEEPEGTEDGE